MKLFELIKADFKNIFRDPTLIAAAIAPFAILIVMIVGLPLLTMFIETKWGYDISEYHRIIKVFFILIIAMVYGMISAFIILDDLDESIISYIKVTPFSIKGYLNYRIGFAFLSSMFGVMLLAFVLFFNDSLSLFDTLYLITVVPLESIFMALFIISYAKNKVEGLALSKMVGVIPFSAIGAFLISNNMKYLLSVFPPFWIVLTIEEHRIIMIIIMIIVSLAIHLLYIALFTLKFKQRLN